MQVLCECTSLQQPSAAATWGKLLQALLAFLDGQTTQGTAGSDADLEEGMAPCSCIELMLTHNVQAPCMLYGCLTQIHLQAYVLRAAAGYAACSLVGSHHGS